jgi:hypothetical protein
MIQAGFKSTRAGALSVPSTLCILPLSISLGTITPSKEQMGMMDSNLTSPAYQGPCLILN